jgi:hypothetical protein
MSDEQS